MSDYDKNIDPESDVFYDADPESFDMGDQEIDVPEFDDDVPDAEPINMLANLDIDYDALGLDDPNVNYGDSDDEIDTVAQQSVEFSQRKKSALGKSGGQTIYFDADDSFDLNNPFTIGSKYIFDTNDLSQLKNHEKSTGLFTISKSPEPVGLTPVEGLRWSVLQDSYNKNKAIFRAIKIKLVKKIKGKKKWYDDDIRNVTTDTIKGEIEITQKEINVLESAWDNNNIDFQEFHDTYITILENREADESDPNDDENRSKADVIVSQAIEVGVLINFNQSANKQFDDKLHDLNTKYVAILKKLDKKGVTLTQTKKINTELRKILIRIGTHNAIVSQDNLFKMDEKRNRLKGTLEDELNEFRNKYTTLTDKVQNESLNSKQKAAIAYKLEATLRLITRHELLLEQIVRTKQRETEEELFGAEDPVEDVLIDDIPDDQVEILDITNSLDFFDNVPANIPEDLADLRKNFKKTCLNKKVQDITIEERNVLFSYILNAIKMANKIRIVEYTCEEDTEYANQILDEFIESSKKIKDLLINVGRVFGILSHSGLGEIVSSNIEGGKAHTKYLQAAVQRFHLKLFGAFSNLDARDLLWEIYCYNPHKQNHISQIVAQNQSFASGFLAIMMYRLHVKIALPDIDVQYVNVSVPKLLTPETVRMSNYKARHNACKTCLNCSDLLHAENNYHWDITVYRVSAGEQPTCFMLHDIIEQFANNDFSIPNGKGDFDDEFKHHMSKFSTHDVIDAVEVMKNPHRQFDSVQKQLTKALEGQVLDDVYDAETLPESEELESLPKDSFHPFIEYMFNRLSSWELNLIDPDIPVNQSLEDATNQEKTTCTYCQKYISRLQSISTINGYDVPEVVHFCTMKCLTKHDDENPPDIALQGSRAQETLKSYLIKKIDGRVPVSGSNMASIWDEIDITNEEQGLLDDDFFDYLSNLVPEMNEEIQNRFQKVGLTLKTFIKNLPELDPESEDSGPSESGLIVINDEDRYLMLTYLQLVIDEMNTRKQLIVDTTKLGKRQKANVDRIYKEAEMLRQQPRKLEGVQQKSRHKRTDRDDNLVKLRKKLEVEKAKVREAEIKLRREQRRYNVTDYDSDADSDSDSDSDDEYNIEDGKNTSRNSMMRKLSKLENMESTSNRELLIEQIRRSLVQLENVEDFDELVLVANEYQANVDAYKK
ncbi:MAG: hypothetical protein JKX76_00805 [Colwellia sp.]|nr:hypothetical protein [Colwellia sp.]